MKTVLPYAAAFAMAASMSLAGQASAQSPGPSAATPPTSATPSAPASPASQPSGQPPASSSATAPTGTDTSTTAAGGGSLTTGMSVKDNTGAIIGEVSGLKAGVATIKMGSDTFNVDASKLGVTNGAATINASQAELKKMLPKK